MKFAMYQIVAVAGSFLLMVSGWMRYAHSGNPKEFIIGILILIINTLIFCF